MDPFALPDPRPPALAELVLNRALVPRPGGERLVPGLVEELLQDPGTRVLAVSGARVAVASGGEDRVELALGSPAGLGPGEGTYLGRDDQGAYLMWNGDLPLARSASLREMGHLLSARDSGLATAAVALSQWRHTHRHCPRCGARTELVEAGWAARCPICTHVVYPRTDPAVIMAVHDGAGRLLLARSVAWPKRRRSVLAGFVEAGEAPEAAVRREVAEEVGVVVDRVSYAGSQPWPFPGSLMLGYHAWAAPVAGGGPPQLRPDGAEITHADWFTRAELHEALAAGRVRLPMRTSIALALVESWYGAPLGD